MRSSFLTLLLLAFFAIPATAQETVPGDVCTAGETDYIRQSGGPEASGVVHLMRCDGANWQQYMTILADGKVGLAGVTNPLYSLDLNTGRIRARGIRSPEAHGQTEMTISGNQFKLDLANRTYIFGNKAGPEASVLNLGISSDTTAPSYINIGHSNLLRVDKGAFRVGVGVAAPEATLDVAGEVKVGNTGGSCVAATEGALRYSTANSCMELCDGLNWACMQAASCPNSLPDAFSFTDEVNATTSTLITSNIQQVTGVTGCTVQVSISGLGSPEYQTCSNGSSSANCDGSIIQDWTSVKGSIQNNQYVRMRLTSSPSGGVNNYADITIGARADRWSVTTQGDCSDPSPAIGTFCSDGTVYAGLSPDGGTKMYTTPCRYGRSWDGSDCSGSAVNVVWAQDITIETGVQNDTQGESNTITLAGLSNADSPYSAAQICDALDFAGHSDWYLPSRFEGDTLSASCSTISDIDCGCGATGCRHWTSTEDTFENARYWREDGGSSPFGTKTLAYKVRCVRKD